ncbi:hypothetical protein SAICODRAFT_221459 [Saitoella complicata NRRL Y-17804]|nr:uncharacterized protein SAICODRAFT_221459 [Saitoella complicata NRRL Y-17804]ODQ53571.1 hypothetical protein SAICODRAFT_221459 [Saitoella complicata NRRL Y-17804]
MPRPRRAPKKAPPMPTAATASTDLPSPIKPANKGVTELREKGEGARPLVSSTPVKEAGGKFGEGLELAVSPIRAGGRNVLEDEGGDEGLLPSPTTEERVLERETEEAEESEEVDVRGGAGVEPSSDDPFGFKSTSRKFGAQLRSTIPKTRPRAIPEAEEEEEEDEEDVQGVPETQVQTEGGDEDDSELSDAQSIATDDNSLELPSSPPKPAPKQRKAEAKGKALRTVDLESLLPRRRTRSGKKKGTYDMSDEDDEDEDEEKCSEDELARSRRRKAKRVASPKKRTHPQKRARTRTRTVSNREEEDSEPELEAPVVDNKVREESRRVRKQFAEVDKWELEVETVSVDLSSQP